MSWFKNYMRQVHLDFHVPEFPQDAIKRFDVQQFVDHLEYGRVNMVTLFAKCHFGNSYYNTVVGHKHAGLDKDFLGSTTEECRRRGIKVLAYYSLCWDKHAWDHNPGWRFRDEEGGTYGQDKPYGRLCMNTPYKDELVIPQLEEIAQYPVDGYFLDIPMPNTNDNLCFCAYCREKFRQEFNGDLADLTSTIERQKVVQQTLVRYLREIRSLIRSSKRGELVVCCNAAGHDRVSKRVKELLDIGVWESQPRPGDYLTHSFACRTGRNDILDVQVMTVGRIYLFGDVWI